MLKHVEAVFPDVTNQGVARTGNDAELWELHEQAEWMAVSWGFRGPPAGWLAGWFWMGKSDDQTG